MEKLKVLNSTNARNSRYDNKDIKSVGNLTGSSTGMRTSKNFGNSRNFSQTNIKHAGLMTSSSKALLLTTNFARDYLLDVIDKSVNIGEFHSIHKINQKLYENRKVQKEINFISNDFNFGLNLNMNMNMNMKNSFDISDKRFYKFFVSKLIKKLFVLDCKSQLAQVDFLDENERRSVSSVSASKKNSISLFNVFEKNKLLIDAELLENVNNVSLALLYNDLTFTKIDFIDFLFSDSDSDKNKNVFKILSENKSKYFNFRPYLPFVKENKINKTNFSSKKIINPNGNLILFNFTSFSDRILIFNNQSYSIIYNVAFNPLYFTRITDNDLTSSIKYFLSHFVKRIWRLDEVDEYSRIVARVNLNYKDALSYKKLAELLGRNNAENLKDLINDSKEDVIYKSLLNMLTHSHSLSHSVCGENVCFINLTEVLNRLEILLQKLKKNSTFYESGNFEQLNEKENTSNNISNTEIFYIKLFKRRVDLKETLASMDKERKFYIPKKDVMRVLNNLPIGLLENELESILNSPGNFHFDEFNNLLYPFFINKEEYLLNKLIYDKKKEVGGRNYFGFFNKQKSNNNNISDFAKIKRKNSDVRELGSIICELNSNSNNNINIDDNSSTSTADLIIDSLIQNSIETFISNMIYIPTLNLFFVLSDKNKDKIFLFKINPDFDNKSKIRTEMMLLGYIETFSLLNPRLLYFIEEKNLLLTQSFNAKGEVDLILIDIFKDIVDIYQTNNLWLVSIPAKGIRKSFSSCSIEDIFYLPGNKLIYVRNALNEIKIVNPKTKMNDLSIKYFYELNKESVFDYVCRVVCEKPSELTGDAPFKVVKDVKVGRVSCSHVIPFVAFTQDKNYSHNYPFEYILLINSDRDNLTVSAFGIYTLFLNLPAKSNDTPLLNSEMEQLKLLSNREKNKILKESKICLENSKKNNELISNEKKLFFNSLKEKIKNIVVKNVDNVESTKLFTENESINETLRTLHTNTHEVFDLFKQLNVISEYKEIINFTSEFLLNKKTADNNLNNSNSQQWLQILEVFSSIGMNSMSYFRRIKNNKIEFVKINKKSFANLVSSKINLFKEKKLIPNSTDEENLFDEILETEFSYDLLENKIFKFDPKMTSIKPTIKYTVENNTKILPLINGGLINSHEDEDNNDEINTNAMHLSSPLDSALRKLIKRLLEKEIRLENSFSVFDPNNEEIIDKKQFIEGFNSLEIYESMHPLEIDTLFRKIDLNETDCVTEDEYYQYIDNSNLKDIAKEIKLNTAARLNDRFFKNMSEIKFFNNEVIESICEKRKSLYEKNDDEWIYLKFLHLFNFLESNIGMQLEVSFKFFDVLHNGIVFCKQFRSLLKQNKSGLTESEIDAIFTHIDYNNKKFFIYEHEYYFTVKNVLNNPGVNKKKYIKILNEEIAAKKESDETLTKIKIVNYTTNEEEYSYVLYNFFKRMNQYFKSKNVDMFAIQVQVEDNSKKTNLMNFFMDNFEYLPVEKFSSKLHVISEQFSDFELKIICDYFIDVNKFLVIYPNEFKNKIESFAKIVSNIEARQSQNQNQMTKIIENPNTSINNNSNEVQVMNTIHSVLTTESLEQSAPSTKMSFKTPQDFLRNNQNNLQLFFTLNMIQESLRSTGLKPEDIFFLLDREKKGFITLTSLLENIPTKLGINLTINQQMLFFSFLDRDRDGLVLFSDFQPFFETQFSTLTFEDQSIEFYALLENFQDNFLIFLNRFKDVDIRNIFDLIVAHADSQKGFLQIDDLLFFFKQILNVKLNAHDGKLIVDLLFNQKNNHSKHSLLGLRKFIIMLEIFGVNTLLYTNYHELNELVDFDLLNLIQNLHNVIEFDVMNLFVYFEKYDDNKDGFLTANQLKTALRDCKIQHQSQIRIINRLVDVNNNNLISISNFVFVLNYLLHVYFGGGKNILQKNGSISYPKFELENIDRLNKLNFFTLNNLLTESKDIVYLSSEYQNLIYKGVFSGLIIFSKFFEANNLLNLINNRNKKIIDYFTLFAKKANEIIIKNFNERVVNKSPDSKINNNNNNNNSSPSSDLSQVTIPNITISILDQKEMFNREIFSSNLGESFIYYHPEMNRTIKVTKYRKTFLLKAISADGQNLMNHIEFSIKVNHCLRNNLTLTATSNEQSNTNANANFFTGQNFFYNYGIFSREIVLNQREEEEIYILDEMINEDEYLSLAELIKSNGGLLNIPELFDTDMTFYMIRFWANKILKFFTILKELSICVKYLTLSDILISKDGKDIKLKPLQHCSFFNSKGRVLSGPDLRNILLLYNKNDIHVEDFDITGISSYKIKVPPLTYEDYDDSFIAPEFLLQNSKLHTNKLDTWLFGVILFSLLFGREPVSYISQLKSYIDNHTNLIFEKISYPMEIVSEDNNFFFYPFKDLPGYELEKVIVPSIKLKSFSATVPKKHLNTEIENNSSVNGLGIVLDLINACLSPKAEHRPDLTKLYNSDLFRFDNYEMILVNKFSLNCLKYFSPELIIIKNMLIPLRQISSRVMQDIKVINEYENFIFSVIKNLNEYFFAKKYFNKGKENGNTSTNKDEDQNLFSKRNKVEFITNSGEYNKTNSQIIKAIFEYKILDIINFLILRHFSINLKDFKKNSDKKYAEIFKINGIVDKKTEFELRKQRYYYMKEEMERECGRLIKAYVDFLYNCVISMSDYENMVSSYVENIIEYITRLFIGEDHMFGSVMLNLKNSFACGSGNSSNSNGIRKYIHFRTFFRSEHQISKDFIEDEADKIWSILNNNVDLCDRETFWSPELYIIVNPLYREAVTETGNGNYKYPVIKNYFTLINAQSRNVNDILDNPFLNNDLNQHYSVNSILSKNQQSLTQTYLCEILALNECAVNLITKDNVGTGTGSVLHSEPGKNLANKKSALMYIHSIFRSRNLDKIRAMFDFKIHRFIEKFLFIHFNDMLLKTEVLHILKEISFGLVDIDELSWLFGNNYSKILEKTVGNKSDPFETSDLNEELNWDSNFSLVQFLNKTLQTSHSFILQFTDRFLGIGSNFSSNSNKYSNLNSFTKRNQTTAYIKEFGQIFASPLFLKPLLRILQKSNESISNRQTSLEILFNLMISNNEKLIANMNSTMCNFYEALIRLLQTHNMILFNSADIDSAENDYSAVALSNSNAQNNFKMTVKNIIYILIEIQNPLIKSQMFKSFTMQKFMKENNLAFTDRYDIEEIYAEFEKLKYSVNFTKHVEKINKLINSFKCWLQHFYLEESNANNSNNANNKVDKKFETIILTLIHIMNVEWKEGLKNAGKNCMIFNIVKLFEWLCKKKLHNFLFNLSESSSIHLIIYFMTKIKDLYLSIVIEDNVVNDSKLKNFKKIKSNENNNITGNKYSSLHKIYHSVCIKMLNILSNVFNMNDDFYNELLIKTGFGNLIGELMKMQYDILGQIFDKRKNDINLLNNYIQENKLRLDLLEGVLICNREEIKIQFLDSDFIEFLVTNLMTDFRKFYTDFKKLSLEFLVFKESYPVRMEAISFINLIIRKQSPPMIKGNRLIYDEMIKNIKKYHLIQQEVVNIKNSIKGSKVHNVFLFISIIVYNKNKDLLAMMEQENFWNYLNYSIEKDPQLKKMFPEIWNCLNCTSGNCLQK